MSETDLQASILVALKQLGVWAWRTNSGVAKMESYYIRLAPKGTPDILGILPGGKLLGIEVKLPGKKPTVAQQDWLDKARHMGAVVGVARSVRDAVAIVQSAGKPASATRRADV